jgi:hypothetical protein
MRHALLIAFALALFSCGDDTSPNADDDNGSGMASKLERPNTLPRPPSRGLPDELRPPR